MLLVPAERLYRETVWLDVFTPKVCRAEVTTTAKHTEGLAVVWLAVQPIVWRPVHSLEGSIVCPVWKVLLCVKCLYSVGQDTLCKTVLCKLCKKQVDETHLYCPEQDSCNF